MSIRFGNLVIAQEKSKIKAGEGKKEGVYKFFTSSNIKTKYVDFFQYDKPALIFGTGGIPSVHYCDEPFSTSTDCIVFYSNSNDYNLKSLYLFFESHMQILEDGFHGAGLQHISKKYILDIQVPDISIDKQTTINSIGDRLNKLIAIKKQQLKNYDNLVKSRFIEMFGDIAKSEYKYPTSKLGEVANVGSSHRVFTTEFVEDGIPFYRGTEIGELANGNKPTEPFYISKEHYKKIANDETKPKIGDLLMPSICNKGQIWRVDTEEPFYYKDGRVLCISADRTKYNTFFLQTFMKEKTIVEYPKLGSGSTFAEFKIFLLKDIDVLTPPIKLQNQFADFVKQTDKSKLAIEKSIEKLEILKKSLMQEYFG